MPESSDRNLLVDKLQYDHLVDNPQCDHLVDNPQYERLCNFSAGHYLHIHQLAEWDYFLLHVPAKTKRDKCRRIPKIQEQHGCRFGLHDTGRCGVRVSSDFLLQVGFFPSDMYSALPALTVF